MGFNMINNYISVSDDYNFKWVHFRKSEAICKDIEDSAGPEGITESYLTSLVNGSIDDYRKICTYIDFRTSNDKGWYDVQKCIRDLCIKRFNDILGSNISQLYYFIRDNMKDQHWLGDECYKLFSYSLLPYSERSIMKSLVTLLAKFDGKHLIDVNCSDIISMKNNLQMIHDFTTCINGKLYWNLYDEPSTISGKYLHEYQSEGDKIGYIDACRKLDKHKEKHMNMWYIFMNHIINHEWIEAYEMTIMKTGTKGFDYV